MKYRPLTLLELVITLALLAALTAVVFTMSGDTLEEGRYDRTVRAAEQIQHGIWNDVPAAANFLSDMGRMPKVKKDDSKSGQRLFELFKGVTNKDMFNKAFVITPSSDNYAYNRGNALNLPDKFVRAKYENIGVVWESTTLWQEWLPTYNIRSGWNGPYVSSPKLRELDGWGREWRILNRQGKEVDATSNNPADKTEIWGVMSYGSDNKAETDASVTAAKASDIPAFSQDITVLAFPQRYPLEMNTPHPPPVELVVKVFCQDPVTGNLYEPALPPASLDALYYSKMIRGANYAVGALALADNGLVYRCAAVSGDPAEAVTESPTAPALGYALHDRYRDSKIYWERHFPASNHVNSLRFVVTQPYVNDNYSENRPYHYVTRFDNLNDNPINRNDQLCNATRTANVFTFRPNDNDNNQINRLLPGKRKIWAMGYYLLPAPNDNLAVNCLQSDVLEVNLKPGVNEVTLILKEKF